MLRMEFAPADESKTTLSQAQFIRSLSWLVTGEGSTKTA